MAPAGASSSRAPPWQVLLLRSREVADVLAYLLQFAAACGVDPLAALAGKIERNELRFPTAER